MYQQSYSTDITHCVSVFWSVAIDTQLYLIEYMPHRHIDRHADTHSHTNAKQYLKEKKKQVEKNWVFSEYNCDTETTSIQRRATITTNCANRQVKKIKTVTIIMRRQRQRQTNNKTDFIRFIQCKEQYRRNKKKNEVSSGFYAKNPVIILSIFRSSSLFNR